MTEREWLICEDPAAMLRHLTRDTFEPGWKPLATRFKLRAWVEGCRNVFDPAREYPPLSPEQQIEAATDYWSGSSPGSGKDRAALLRDVAGNPFRPVAVDPAWLAWDDGAVGRMAREIYDERAWDQLPILGDALHDAGCTCDDMIAHCRSPGPHVRGCWVVDSLLGKE